MMNTYNSEFHIVFVNNLSKLYSLKKDDDYFKDVPYAWLKIQTTHVKVAKDVPRGKRKILSNAFLGTAVSNFRQFALQDAYHTRRNGTIILCDWDIAQKDEFYVDVPFVRARIYFNLYNGLVSMGEIVQSTNAFKMDGTNKAKLGIPAVIDQIFKNWDEIAIKKGMRPPFRSVFRTPAIESRVYSKEFTFDEKLLGLGVYYEPESADSSFSKIPDMAALYDAGESSECNVVDDKEYQEWRAEQERGRRADPNWGAEQREGRRDVPQKNVRGPRSYPIRERRDRDSNGI